jgi:hypothetical protein
MLPLNIRTDFREAFSAQVALGGLEGAFAHLNGRTVQDIIDEYAANERPDPLVSGEIEGIHFKPFERPDNSERELG